MKMCNSTHKGNFFSFFFFFVIDVVSHSDCKKRANAFETSIARETEIGRGVEKSKEELGRRCGRDCFI
jgi:hypothetical protein